MYIIIYFPPNSPAYFHHTRLKLYFMHFSHAGLPLSPHPCLHSPPPLVPKVVHLFLLLFPLHIDLCIFPATTTVLVCSRGVAFTVALHQNRALIGKRGLLPADMHLRNIRQHVDNDRWRMFTFAPTILWLHDYESDLDQLLDILAYGGIVLSAIVFTLGAANMPLIFAIWALYHSLVNVGQRW